jgi:hypothetical protein
MLFAAGFALSALAAPTHASTPSKAVRTGDSLEPALCFHEQEQAFDKRRFPDLVLNPESIDSQGAVSGLAPKSPHSGRNGAPRSVPHGSIAKSL